MPISVEMLGLQVRALTFSKPLTFSKMLAGHIVALLHCMQRHGGTTHGPKGYWHPNKPPLRC